MSAIRRGAANAFRNTLRTISVTVILAISIGLAIVMLLSYKAVQAKITTVTETVGTTVSISPAGAQGFEGGGEPLTQAELDKLNGIAHIKGVVTTLQERLTPNDTTSLQSAIEPGTLGNRRRSSDQVTGAAPTQLPSGATSDRAGTTPARSFTLPVMVTGISDASSLTSNGSTITAGRNLEAGSTALEAVVGTTLAAKNSLSIGSAFTMYGQVVTVVGIYDSGNQFTNSSLTMPIAAVQTVADQVGEVSTATVTVDSASNLAATTAAIQSALGGAADVTSNADQAKQAIAPLESIKKISFYSLIGALVAGSVITLLTMMMIVRERRREIGVLKAIGSSNLAVVGQFVSESLVLTFMGSVVGVIGGVIASNPVLKALLSNASSAATTVATQVPGGGPGGVGRGFEQALARVGGGIQTNISDLHATVGFEILLYGIGAALLIAVIGSVIPAWLIAQVKPAEVMRGE